MTVVHRLVTGRGRVNNRKTSISEYDSAVLKYSLVIRPTMSLRTVHPRHSIR